MKRCSKCVLPSSCPGIGFDANGICNVCHDFDERWKTSKQQKFLKRQELDRIIGSFRNIGEKYDCLVPLSGGFDSTYVLYVCRSVYNLRTLAFNFNNGFRTALAEQNIKNAVNKLKVDFVSEGPTWEEIRRLYALFFKKTGEFCTPCNLGIWSMSYKIAQENGIPLIVSGSSDRISERLPKGHRIYSWSISYFKKVIQGEISTENVKEYLYLPEDFHKVKLRPVLASSPSSKNISTLPLFDYIEYNTKLMLEILEHELNWQQRANKFHHIDCVMETVNDYFKQKKWGFSTATWNSMLVRNKQISRKKALELTVKEEAANSREPPELELWLQLLGLSRQDLEGVEKRRQAPYLNQQEQRTGS